MYGIFTVIHAAVAGLFNRFWPKRAEEAEESIDFGFVGSDHELAETDQSEA